MADEALIKSRIEAFDGFPKKGIVFRDIFSVLREPPTFRLLIEKLIKKINDLNLDPDAIVGLDARGFIFGSILAYELGKPFIPVRKRGKLPGDVQQISYKLEYGEDCLEVQIESLKSIGSVVVVDDLLATGGTMKAALDLLELAGVDVSLCLVCIELVDLEGRQKLDVPCETIVQF